jgi:hypothetical protein
MGRDGVAESRGVRGAGARPKGWAVAMRC